MLDWAWSLLVGEVSDLLASFVDAAPLGVDGAVFVPEGPAPFCLPVLEFALCPLLTVFVPTSPTPFFLPVLVL